jgi:signal transduction histidine kinase
MRKQALDAIDSRMPLLRLTSRSPLAIGIGYLAGYVLLDWVSYVYPFGVFGITPWNPQTGLSFALILLFGVRFLPWLVIAPLFADIVLRGLPVPIAAEIPIVLIIGLTYGAAAALLLSPRMRFEPTLSSRRSVLALMGVAVASIAVVSFGHVLVLWLVDLVAPVDFFAATARAFVGDLIGVMVFTPFLLIVFTRRKLPALSGEVVAAVAVTLIALWGVFGFADAFRFQLFYVFFIPIVWIAVRFGLEGVTLGLVLTQIGLLVAMQISGQTTVDVVSYQALMVVLSMTGLAVGVVVSEQSRTQHQLRLHQEALNRASRLGTMGEFAAAVAHEINQPLTAIATYSRLAKSAVEQVPPDSEAAARAASDAIEQVTRAASVIQRLRELIGLGRIQQAPTRVAKILDETSSICRPELDRANVDLDLRIADDLPLVMVDALQVEQVLLNLIRNAKEALVQAGRHDGRIVIEAAWAGADAIMLNVTDNGPGLDPDLVGQPITPFTSTKSDGLGLGLALSRSIVEAHGGSLKVESRASGLCVSFTLPVAATEEQAA